MEGPVCRDFVRRDSLFYDDWGSWVKAFVVEPAVVRRIRGDRGVVVRRDDAAACVFLFLAAMVNG
jgi:hypothetical protein